MAEVSIKIKLVDLLTAPFKRMSATTTSALDAITSRATGTATSVNTVSKSIGGLRTELDSLKAKRDTLIDEKQIRSANAEIKKLNAELHRLENLPPSSLNRGIGAIKQSLSGIGGMIAGAFAVSSIVDFGKSIIQTGMEAEQTTVAYNVLLGGADKASGKIAELQKFADVSPFNTKEVMNAGQALLGFGTKAQNLLPIMNHLGDVSMGNSDKFKRLVDNYGKIVSSQGADVTDIDQFATAGVPLWEKLGQKIGLQGAPLRKYVSENKVSVAQIDQMLTELTSKGGAFFGMMDAQAQSTAGRWSTLASRMEAVMIKIFVKMQPTINRVIGMLGMFIDKAKVLYGYMKQVAQVISDNIVLINGIGIVIGGAILAYGLFRAELFLTTGIFEMTTLAQKASIAWTVIQTTVTNALTASTWKLNLAFLASPIGWVVITVAALVAGFYVLWNYSEKTRGFLFGLYNVFKSIVMIVAELIKAIYHLFTMDFKAFWGNIKNIGTIGANIGTEYEKGVKEGVKDFRKDKNQEALGKNIKENPLVAKQGYLPSYMSGIMGDKKNPVDALLKTPETTKDAFADIKPPSGVSGEGNSSKKIVNVRIDQIKVEVKATQGASTDLRDLAEKVTDIVVSAIHDGSVVAGM